MNSENSRSISTKWYKKINVLYYVLYLLLGVILVIPSIFEYKSAETELKKVLHNQASLISRVVSNAGEGQMRLGQELLKSYIDRAVELLASIDRLEQINDSETLNIDEIYPGGEVFRIMALTPNLDVEWSVSHGGQSFNRGYGPGLVKRIEPIVSGEVDTLIVKLGGGRGSGGRRSFAHDDSRFMIALKRSVGGVLIATLSIESEQNLSKNTNISTVFEEIITEIDLAYACLTLKGQPALAVSSNNDINEFLETRKYGILDSNLVKVDIGDKTFLEVQHPISINSISGTLALGFDYQLLYDMQNQLFRKIVIRTTLLILLAIFTFVFIMSKQRERLLAKEKRRIQHEVEILERNNRIQERQAALGELAAGVAHEIRNPLNAIGIATQRIQKEFIPTEDNTNEYTELTSMMSGEINRINQTLKEFLDYARPTKMNKVDVKIESLVQELFMLYKHEVNPDVINVQIEIEPSLIVKADQDVLKQVLGNLLKNAIEAIHKEGSINIKSWKQKNEILIQVSDDGIGINKKDINHIFDLYFSTKEQGTGIGLAISHKLIQDSGGTIEAWSEEGEGTTMTIHLPV